MRSLTSATTALRWPLWLSKLGLLASGIEDLNVLADRGYFSGEQILACEQARITAYVPKPLTSASKAEGGFGNQDFVYDAHNNEYRYPAGQSLIYRYTNLEAGLR